MAENSKSLTKPIRSPLRYPGGKTRAVRHILPYIPMGLTTAASPFCGGCSVEFALDHRGIEMHCYDAFDDLIVFWQVLQSDPEGLSTAVRRYYPLSRDHFYQLQKKSAKNRLEQAAIFYALNRASFCGTTKSGGMSPNHPRFTVRGIESLREFRFGGTFTAADFSQSIPNHRHDFMYLDPPYAIEGDNLYGVRGSHHKGFDHNLLYELLADCQSWVLSYNDSPLIRKMYARYTIVELQWAYGMNKSKKSNEILIIKD